MLSTHGYLGHLGGLFLSGFPANILYAFSSPHYHAACPAHLILRDLTILIIPGEEHKLWSSSLRSFLYASITPSLLSRHSSQHSFLRHPPFVFLSYCQRPSFTPIQNYRQNYNLYIKFLHF
jgi:hypothetical protein